jgi:predicted kinase
VCYFDFYLVPDDNSRFPTLSGGINMPLYRSDTSNPTTGIERNVYLLVGQRGSGKSSYARHLVAAQPELSIISRDEILVRKFGSTDTNPYTGEQWYALEVMHRFLRFVLKTKPKAKLILDCWTGGSKERKALIRKLRDYGATRIVALYFTTPRDVVSTWFWLKPGLAKITEMHTRQGQNLTFFSEDAPLRDYDLFHQMAQSIDSDGFDEVIRIDPREKIVHLT